MKIDDINAMADANIIENEINKLAEEVYGKGVNHDYEEGFVDGYNKAKELMIDNLIIDLEQYEVIEEEDDEIKFIKKQLQNIEHYKMGYNAAETKLYTEEQVKQAMLEMCEYIIDSFERRILIDTNEKAKEIIQALKP